MATIPPVINVGPDGPTAYLQKGLQYGVNDSGPFQSFSRRGTQAEIESLAPSFNVEGWTYTVTREGGGLARLDAHAGWSLGSTYSGETPENIWELDSNETEKDLLDADFPEAGYNTLGNVLAGLSKTDRVIVRNDLNNPSFNELASGSFDNADDPADAESIYLLMHAGVKSFPVECSVIRHTQLVSNRYTAKASFNNVRRIISTASMTSVEGVPTDLLFDPPSEPTVTQFIEDSGDLVYGWRKLRPNVTRLARFKWRIVQNWQFGLWARRIYGDAI